MTSLEALVLGLVQGLTEFLPVSSSGHLVIGQTLFGLTEPQLAFDVLVHGATLVAVLVAFRRRIATIVARREVDYVGKIALGTLPAVAVALLFGERVEAAFGAPGFVAAALAVTGLALLSLYLRQPSALGRPAPSWTAALVIGCAQAVAVLPGISRAGSTIVAALWLGLAPAAAAEFSFLLGVPAIAGAVVWQAADLRAAAAVDDRMADFALGSAMAFASGLVAIAIVFRVLEGRTFRRFGFYCVVVAAAFAAWLRWAAA